MIKYFLKDKYLIDHFSLNFSVILKNHPTYSKFNSVSSSDSSKLSNESSLDSDIVSNM